VIISRVNEFLLDHLPFKLTIYLDGHGHGGMWQRGRRTDDLLVIRPLWTTNFESKSYKKLYKKYESVSSQIGLSCADSDWVRIGFESSQTWMYSGWGKNQHN